MKKALILLLVMALLMTIPVPVSAAEVTEARVPVTLTVVNTVHPISVTVPASLPISMVDGYVVTANNAVIINHGEHGAVKVTAVDVQPGSFQIGNYSNFSTGDKVIALSINDCPTEKAGLLTISEENFPVINAGKELAIRYKAKISTDSVATNVNAATVIFTIASTDPVDTDTDITEEG